MSRRKGQNSTVFPASIYGCHTVRVADCEVDHVVSPSAVTEDSRQQDFGQAQLGLNH